MSTATCISNLGELQLMDRRGVATEKWCGASAAASFLPQAEKEYRFPSLSHSPTDTLPLSDVRISPFPFLAGILTRTRTRT